MLANIINCRPALIPCLPWRVIFFLCVCIIFIYFLFFCLVLLTNPLARHFFFVYVCFIFILLTICWFRLVNPHPWRGTIAALAQVRSRWVKSDGNPAWSEKLMLCWDGGMPLNIDIYGGKDHIGQVKNADGIIQEATQRISPHV